MEWTGYVFGDKCARLWHQTIGMSFSQIIKEYIDSFLSRRIFIPAYSISSNKIHAYMNKLLKWKPVLIDGYAESFNFLAQYMAIEKKIELSPKAILSSAQILPKQSRRIISKIFGAKVYDKYGSREFSGIAYESGEEDVHLVVAENYIVEIIKNNKPAKPGELGEIIVTDLNNKCLPFLRYKIGDLAIALDSKRISKCGRGLPLIGRIEGRVQAIIIGVNNNFLPGTFFAHFFKEFIYCILQYQIIQNVYGEVDLKIIKGSRFTIEQFNSILDELRVHLGDSMKINVEFVNEIAMVRTGKHQGAISNIKIDFQNIHEVLKS
jgi:phenylacetate-CoA ligase